MSAGSAGSLRRQNRIFITSPYSVRVRRYFPPLLPQSQGKFVRAIDGLSLGGRPATALAVNRAKFVDGPVLLVPLHHTSIQFNPQSLQPLEKSGTVYPTLHISADWGVLEVQNGALLKPDWSAVSVVAPTSLDAALKGDGWTLVLNPNWKMVPAERKGDFTLAGPAE